MAAAPLDCGQKSLVFTFVNLMSGSIQTVNQVTLDVTPGQGMLLLEPPTLPMVGELTEGTLVICSEYFPALAPLRIQLAGADMRFLVQSARLVNYTWRTSDRSLLRVQCTPTPDANVAYRLENLLLSQKQNRILIHRERVQPEREQIERRTLNIEVLRGAIQGLGQAEYNGPIAVFERLDLLRDTSGVLELRLLASWFELIFIGGALHQLRCFEEHGLVASIVLLGAHAFGGSHSVAFRDVLS